MQASDLFTPSSSSSEVRSDTTLKAYAMHKQFPSLIANQNLCDKGAKVEARSNKAGVRGDRLQLGEKQRKDVGVVWHVHLAR